MATVIDAIIHLTDQFTPNLTRIRDELSETERVTRRSAREVQNLGSSITGIGEKMLPAAAAIAGGIGVSVKQFADFESIITQAGLKADATEAEIKAMGDAVIAAGAKFPISMDETAKAMDRLAAGGFDAQQSIAALAPVIQAAVASGEDMGAVSDVVTSALSSWHLLTGDVSANAEMVADVIQMASNKSKLGVQDLGVAFQYAAPNAAALGDSVQTVSAILAVMANNGIAASTAGTSLRSAYLNLASGAKPAREAIEQLELQVFDGNGKFLGMRKLLDDLRGKLKGMSDADATPILRKLFGTEGVSAILGYINTAEEETNKMFDAMENAQGSSAAAFEKMSKTLSGQLNAIQGAFQAFTLRIGQAAAPMLAPFVNSLQRLVDILSKMPDEQVQMLIQLGLGFIGLTAGVLALGKAISILGSFSAFLAPVGKSLAEGATLSSLFTARLAPIGTVFNHIKNVGVLALNQLLSPFRSMGGVLASPFQALGRAAGQTMIVFRGFASPIEALRTGFDSLKQSFRLSSLVSNLTAFRGAIVSGFGNIISTLGKVRNIPQVFGRIVASGRQLLSLRGIFTALVNGVRALSLAFAANPIGLALLAIGAVVLLVATNWKLFQNVAEVVWNKISYVVTQVINTLSTTFQTFKARMGSHFDTLVGLWKKLTGEGESSGGALSTVVNTLASAFTAGFTIIGSVVELVFAELETIINGIMGVITGLGKVIVGVATGDWKLAWEGIKDIVMSVVGAIIETVENMVATTEDAIARLRGHEGTSMKRLEFERGKKAAEKTSQSYSALSVDEQLSQGAARHSERNKPGENALGTMFWRGGLTWVHEQGPEIIDLPTGTRIIPHSSSLNEEYNRGFNAGATFNTVNKNESENFFEDIDDTSIINEGAEYAANNSVSNVQNGGANYFESNPLLRVLNEVRNGDTLNNENNTFNSYYYNSGNNSNIREAESTGNPSSKIIERQDAPKPPVNVNVQIPKLAEQIIVREKSDINDIVNQLVYRFQAHAINRVVHAVR